MSVERYYSKECYSCRGELEAHSDGNLITYTEYQKLELLAREMSNALEELKGDDFCFCGDKGNIFEHSFKCRQAQAVLKKFKERK